MAERDDVLGVIRQLGSEVLQGKEQVVRLAMMALLSGGHLLLEDIPGLGKTSLALALSRALGLSFGRIQCTSDLLPSDITGLSIFDQKEGDFRFVPGPVFNHLVLVDEINRAMPKTQSALLEAMEERRVTVEGKTYPLPDPFLVIATQNPSEQFGTFPLPESQMDRFLVTSGIGYPPATLEKKIFLHGSIRNELEQLKPLLSLEQILAASRQIQDDVFLSEKVAGYILALVEESRQHPMVATGISTRGGLGLVVAAKVSAYLAGRDFVAPEDVQDAMVPVGAHRLILKTENSILPKEEVIRSLVEKVPVPLT